MKNRLVAVAIICIAAFGIGLAACSQIRSDAAIISDVQARIGSDASLAGKTIAIQSSGGTVVLTGNVNSDAERAAAETAAKQVEGVKGVINNLQVVATAVTPPVAQPPVASQVPAPTPKRPTVVPAKTVKPAPAPQPVPPNTKAVTAETQKAAPEVLRLTIPEGTSLSVRLIDAVDTAKNKEGDTFRATLDAPVVMGENTIIPKNSDVEVKLVSAKSAGQFTGSSAVVLTATKVAVAGKMYDLETGEFTKQGSSRGKRTAAVVGGGAAAGAVIGGIVGGGKGAAIGAATGAGAGTGVQALTKGQQIQLPSETVLEFQLKAPLTVTPAPPAITRQKIG